MKKLHCRNQQTISRPVEVHGVGYLTGAQVTLRFLPASANTGVIFVRTDLKPIVQIPACLDQVTGTNRRTTLGNPPASVTMVEHVLAALAGLHIDNCYIEINALEPPGLDGSAGPIVRALRSAGTKTQQSTRSIWGIDQPILVRKPGATLAIHPHSLPEYRLSYFLDYGQTSPIMPQRHTQSITAESFYNFLGDCRTFLLEAEAEEMKRQGIGTRTKVSDLVVFGKHGPVDNRLRFANEPARHKALDIIGDLSLIGHDIRGHVVAYRSGHPLNIELGKEIYKQIQTAESSNKQAA